MNLVDVLKELNIPYREHGQHHHATQGWIQIDCPFCSRNNNQFRLGLSIEGRSTNCWTCGSHRLVEALSSATGLRFQDIKKLLGSLDTWVVSRAETIKGRLKIPAGVGPLQAAHTHYLKEVRGFNPDKLSQLWGIQGIGLARRYAWTLFIPVHYQGEVVSFTTRELNNEGMRYCSADKTDEALPLKTLLYGQDYCRNTILVTEGPTDVWNIGPGAVCTFGLTVTKAQITKIAQYPTRIICFDNGHAAQAQARKLCNDLSFAPGRTLRVELDAKDPGSASRKEIQTLRRAYLE